MAGESTSAQTNSSWKYKRGRVSHAISWRTPQKGLNSFQMRNLSDSFRLPLMNSVNLFKWSTAALRCFNKLWSLKVPHILILAGGFNHAGSMQLVGGSWGRLACSETRQHSARRRSQGLKPATSASNQATFSYHLSYSRPTSN